MIYVVTITNAHSNYIDWAGLCRCKKEQTKSTEYV